MRLLRFFFCMYICVCVPFLYAQDSTANKRQKENPTPEAQKNEPAKPTDPPKPAEGASNNANPFAPPTFSGQTNATSGSNPAYITITKEEYEREYGEGRSNSRGNGSNARRDTLPPKYIADASYLPIISWDMPAVGANTVQVDSNVSVIKPTILTSQRNDVLLELNTWKQESRVLSIPITIENQKEAHFSRYFNLPESPKNYKKLFLYFEGVAWRSEVKLNGKFLGINENPFQPWAIAIDPKWLREEDNYLEVSLRTESKDLPFYPKPFLGIFRPVFIVNEVQLNLLTKPIMEEIRQTKDTVAIYAPYFYSKKYVFDKFQAINVLLHAKRAGISHIYFLFPPDKELEKVCKELEFVRVKSLDKGQPVAWLNQYPYQAENFAFTEQFWLDEKTFRTDKYRMISPFNTELIFTKKKSYSPFYIFWVLFPLLGMFFIKVLNGKFFIFFTDVFLSPRLAIDKFIESTAGNRGLLVILQIIRVIIVAITLALLADYVQHNNQWHILNSFGGNNGLVFALFGAKSPFWLNILKSLVLVSIWAMIRTFLVRSLSGLFRIYNMYEGLTNLELIGAYPLVFLLPLPLAMLSFIGYEWHNLLIFNQILLMLAYLSRQVYVCYVGMGRLFKFSFSVKWLYIIGGIILPYLICL